MKEENIFFQKSFNIILFVKYSWFYISLKMVSLGTKHVYKTLDLLPVKIEVFNFETS